MVLPIIKRYFIAFGHYKWVGFAAFALTVGAAGLLAMKEEPLPVITASGTLTYTAAPAVLSDTGTKLTAEGKELTKEMLLDQRVLEAVAKQVHLNAKKLKSNWDIKLPTKSTDTSVITVLFKDTDGKLAEKTVNIMMKEMVAQSRLINTSRLRAIINNINQRLPEVTQQLNAAEKSLETYEKEQGVQILAAKTGKLPAGITATEQQQQELGLQLDGLDAQIRTIEQQLGLNAKQAYTALALAADPIIAQLRVQIYGIESQLERLRKNYRDQHPAIIDLLKQQQALEGQLQQRASEVLGGNGIAAPLRDASQIRVDASLDPARQQLAQNLLSLQTQRESLQQQLKSAAKTEQELRRQYATIPNKQLEYDRLAQQVKLKKATYDMMQKILIDAKTAIAETDSSLAIVQPAKATPVEVKEKSLPMLLALGGVGGIVVGGGLIFVLGMLSGKLYSWEEIRGVLQEREVPLLGRLPDVVLFNPDCREMPLILESNSPYLEFYERLRTTLLRVSSQPVKMILLTSGAAKEGKTFCAYNFAITVAKSGKRTLLIEIDLRSPSQIQSLNLAIDPTIRLEPLRYYGHSNESIQLAPDVENLYILPSPGPLSQATAILESSEMRRLLAEVRHRFDYVILDAPALNANNDALLLEPYTDGMILVTRPHYTLAAELAETLDQLTASEDVEEQASSPRMPRLLGVIINGADIPVEFPDAVEELELEPILTSHYVDKAQSRPKLLSPRL